jgi:hypothetical protein
MNLKILISPDRESQDGNEPNESVAIAKAALHTIWDAKAAKRILLAVANEPKLGVFGAIRSTWGNGLEIQNAVEEHFEEMYESGYAEPIPGSGLFDMLHGTRNLAEKLLEAAEFDAAFFFAHAVAAMIRRCEGSEVEDQQEDVVEWAKALDELMSAAVKGWRGEVGDGKAQKADAATLVKKLEGEEIAKGYDQSKWHPNTLAELRAWAK